jgi:hypothetical protein
VSQVPAIQLNDGADIPQLGRCIYKIEPERTADFAVFDFELGEADIDVLCAQDKVRRAAPAPIRTGSTTSRLNPPRERACLRGDTPHPRAFRARSRPASARRVRA